MADISKLAALTSLPRTTSASSQAVPSSRFESRLGSGSVPVPGGPKGQEIIAATRADAEGPRETPADGEAAEQAAAEQAARDLLKTWVQTNVQTVFDAFNRMPKVELDG